MADDDKGPARRWWLRLAAFTAIVIGMNLVEFTIVGATIGVRDHPHRAIALGAIGVLNALVIVFGALILAGSVNITRR